MLHASRTCEDSHHLENLLPLIFYQPWIGPRSLNLGIDATSAAITPPKAVPVTSSKTGPTPSSRSMEALKKWSG